MTGEVHYCMVFCEAATDKTTPSLFLEAYLYTETTYSYRPQLLQMNQQITLCEKKHTNIVQQEFECTNSKFAI